MEEIPLIELQITDNKQHFIFKDIDPLRWIEIPEFLFHVCVFRFLYFCNIASIFDTFDNWSEQYPAFLGALLFEFVHY